MTDTFFHSVTLDKDLCKGCINCIKRCPTQAIRVRDGKAQIIKEFCIDCGECIRVCPHHAKIATYDSLSVIKDFEYTVALPAPSFFGQFNNLDDVNIVLRSLKLMGFDDVFEVSAAAEIVSELSRQYIKNHPEGKPFISSACPTIVRLIRVRFPNLIDHLLPINAPIEIAANVARKQAMKKTGLPSEKIGIIFISPCPAKVTAVYSPICNTKSNIDRVLAVKDVYLSILPYMKQTCNDTEILSTAGKIGISWGASGGEAGGLLTDNYLAADGIENVIKVLEDLEDSKFTDLEFIELNACSGGCVGGVLQVENPYVAKAKLKRLRKYMPVALTHLDDYIPDNSYWTNEIKYEPVFTLGSSVIESMHLMSEVNKICDRLPGLDCGSCGAPTCRTLAEDVIRGLAKEKDCIHLLREYIHKISDDLNNL